LSLTDGTVKNYVSTLLGKTGLRDRTQLAAWAIREGRS
jgi:DNA-binding NarL/FixJ family response regulator